MACFGKRYRGRARKWLRRYAAADRLGEVHVFVPEPERMPGMARESIAQTWRETQDARTLAQHERMLAEWQREDAKAQAFAARREAFERQLAAEQPADLNSDQRRNRRRRALREELQRQLEGAAA